VTKTLNANTFNGQKTTSSFFNSNIFREHMQEPYKNRSTGGALHLFLQLVAKISAFSNTLTSFPFSQL